MTKVERDALMSKLIMLWDEHDKLERQIILIERKFTDKELRRMGAAGG